MTKPIDTLKEFDFKQMTHYLDYYYEITSYEYQDFLKSIKPFEFDNNDKLRKRMDNYQNILSGIRKVENIIASLKHMSEHAIKTQEQEDEEDEKAFKLLSASDKERVPREPELRVVYYKGMYFSLSKNQFAKYLANCKADESLTDFELLRCLASDTAGVATPKV